MTVASAPAPDSLLTDEDRRRDLRRMKAFATSLLVVAAVVYVVARRAEAAADAPEWVSYVRAAAEAGMVGGLADWFAVTALFRHPLGLPIPHTALIPTRKDALGASLGDFVGTNFLAEEVVRERVRQIGLAGRAGGWLREPTHAERVVAEAAAVARGALTVLDDEQVQDLLDHVLVRPLSRLPVGPPLGRLLGQVVADSSHQGLVELVLDELLAWLRVNRARVVELVTHQAPSWSPRFVDQMVGAKVYRELERFVEEVRARADHPARQALDRYLAQLADDLENDADTMAKADALRDRLLAGGQVAGAMREVWGTVRRVLLEAIDDPDSELRRRATLSLVAFGERLVADEPLRRKIDRWAEDAVAHVSVTYRDELTRVITDTVERWDPADTTRRIELRVGRDLQFIRVNGTIVGALAGIGIHAAGSFLA